MVVIENWICVDLFISTQKHFLYYVFAATHYFQWKSAFLPKKSCYVGVFFQSNNFNKFPFHYVLDILPLKSRLVPANVTLPLKFLTNPILFYGYIDYAAKYIKTTHKSRETMNYFLTCLSQILWTGFFSISNLTVS